ncbi:MAG: DNA mismatch repair protein MutS, partial [Clostridia bacterium]|nr:DNA mismatch repair protein MutS [Clostridia bacterium]
MADELLKYNMLKGEVLEKMSPMMRQYLDIKKKHKDCIIMFRLGDFYEMFFDDAILVSSQLGLTLTGRDCGLVQRAPMCGVPYHAVQRYIKQLVEKGFRLAVCEQTTDPALAKGLVEREVVRVITPGTVTEEDLLDEKTHNYIAALFFERGGVGYAYADASTGSFYSGKFSGKECCEQLKNELQLLMPNEVIIPQSMQNGTMDCYIEITGAYYTQSYSDKAFDFNRAASLLMKHFRAASLTSLGISETPIAVKSAGALLAYLSETQMNTLRHISKLTPASDGRFMRLDDFTRVNLELTAPLRRDGAKSSTLLGTLDYTMTAMGGRLIKDYILRPLQSKAEIESRLSAVEELTDSLIALDTLRETLGGMCDIERICAKISSNSINPKNCVSLKYALQKIWQIKEQLLAFSTPELTSICTGIDTLDDMRDL